MSLLTVRDLRTHFLTASGRVPAVDGVSFSVEKGEAVGVVGESGCGKTVTALSIMGLVSPPGEVLPGSSIRLEGRELVGLSAKEMRHVRGRRVGMVFQEPAASLNPVFTIGEQVREGLRLHRKVGRAEARRGAVELLGEVGLPDPERRAGEYPHELSGGMRQRAMIAIALAGEPELLIGDEPTTSLDVTIQAQILDLLAELRRRRRMAMLLITHDLGVVAEVCDRVVVMYAGQVVESGGVGEVLSSPRHPYTRGLLDSLPRLDEPAARLRPIPGTVPPPGAPPSGCRFRDRCPRGWSRCLEPPPLFPVVGMEERGEDGPGEGSALGSRGRGRTSRCWLNEPSATVVGTGAADP